MDDRSDYFLQRDSLDADGREAWNASTRSGDNLQAIQPSDVVALGGVSQGPRATDPAISNGAEAGNGSGSPNDPSAEGSPRPAQGEVRYVKAGAGDSISRLLGASDPGAVGRFLRLNGMDGRSSTIYAGRIYAIPASTADVTSDEISAGNQLLRRDNAVAFERRTAAQAATEQFSDRLNSGLNVWTGRDPYSAAPSLRPASPKGGFSWVDRNGPLKAAAGTAAFVAGLPYGVMRGGVRLGQDIGNAVDFGLRLADPNDAENHPLDEPARDVVMDAGRNAAAYAKTVAADSSVAARDVGHALHEANVALNPFATPIAPTLAEEMHRDLGLGANWGELGFQVGTALEGGAEAAALRAEKPLSQSQKVAKLLNEGFDETTAAYLAEPYVGRGSHYVPRRTRIPALSSTPLPKTFMDSPFNVSKPLGMSRDEFYRYHYAVDPRFHGAKLPAGMRGLHGHAGWRGSDLALAKYDPVDRAWHGAPGPLKQVVGGIGIAPILAGYDFGGADVSE